MFGLAFEKIEDLGRDIAIAEKKVGRSEEIAVEKERARGRLAKWLDGVKGFMDDL